MDPVIRSNKTCRSSGAVGKDAIVPKWVGDHCSDKTYRILDFGAGKKMRHVHALRERGFQNVAGYEFGENITSDHILVLSPRSFPVVYASNVFNTHSDALMSATALHLIRETLKYGGHFIFNMPSNPNYFWGNVKNFLPLVTQVFGSTPAKVDPRGIYLVRRDKINEKYLLNA